MALDENIVAKLEAACAEARVVFWEDEAGEFAQDVSELELPGVAVISVRSNEMAVKRRVLREERDGRFLLYRAGGAPKLDLDFLADVKAFARPFSATQSASWAEELGLSAGVVGALAAHAEFFRSKARRAALARFVSDAEWIGAESDAPTVELAMLAVCCGSSDAHRIDAYRSIAGRLLEHYALDDDATLRLIGRCDLMDALWRALGEGFGYQADEPSVEDFALECMFSACADLTGAEPALTSDASVLLSDMAHDSRREHAYDALVDKTSEAVLSECHLEELPTDVLAAHRYLPAVDDVLVRRLIPDVRECVDVLGRVAEIRARRASAAHFSGWAVAYDALCSASAVLSGEQVALRDISSAGGAACLAQLYQEELWRFDAEYRHLIARKREVEQLGVPELCELYPLVEAAYAHVLEALAVAWQSGVADGGAWPPECGVPAQSRFYGEKIRVAEGRCAVVVSDALRYEMGAEWAKGLAERTRLSARTTALISSLPSFTQLGMAALLPHGELEIDPSTHLVTSDGAPTSGLSNRQKILAEAVAGACAVRAEDLLSGDAAHVGDAPLAYVYHNEIDKTGDDALSERRVFHAAESAFLTLDAIVRRLVSLGFGTVFVTADHGFLYQDDVASLEMVDFPDLGSVLASGPARHSRRFLVAGQIPSHPNLFKLSAAQLGLAGTYEVALPKGTRRLRLQGSGARYVHGGMTLQETLVPCITVTSARGGSAPVRPVGFDLLTGGQSVITGAFLSFDVYQSEPVSEAVVPVQLRAALYDASGRMVSEQVALELASVSSAESERHYRVRLAVGTGVGNNERLTLRLERRVGTTSRYATAEERTYRVRRNFGMDF